MNRKCKIYSIFNVITSGVIKILENMVTFVFTSELCDRRLCWFLSFLYIIPQNRFQSFIFNFHFFPSMFLCSKAFSFFLSLSLSFKDFSCAFSLRRKCSPNEKNLFIPSSLSRSSYFLY